jgi:Secretion system C-terminal sorting domain
MLRRHLRNVTMLGIACFISQVHAQQTNLVLQDTTISTLAIFSASNSITAGPNFTIAANGNVIFHTNGNVYMRPTVTVIQGGSFQVVADSTVSNVSLSGAATIPTRFALDQNYPNPFNPTTTFSFDLPGSSHVTLAVFDILGREVARVVDEILPAGNYARTFDASRLASGMYIYRLTAGEYSETKRMMLLK